MILQGGSGGRGVGWTNRDKQGRDRAGSYLVAVPRTPLKRFSCNLFRIRLFYLPARDGLRQTNGTAWIEREQPLFEIECGFAGLSG